MLIFFFRVCDFFSSFFVFFFDFYNFYKKTNRMFGNVASSHEFKTKIKHFVFINQCFIFIFLYNSRFFVCFFSFFLVLIIFVLKI